MLMAELMVENAESCGSSLSEMSTGRSLPVDQQLKSLVSRQNKSKEDGESAPFLDVKGVELYKAFWNSQLSYEVEDEAEKAIECPDMSHEEYMKGLRGAAFEKIAFGYISAKEAVKGNTVIPGSGVFELCKNLNPEGEIMNNSFGRMGIRGIYVPDGLLVDNQSSIVGILEYTLSRSRDKLIHQRKGASGLLSRDLQSLTRQHDKEAQFIHVMPKEENGKKSELENGRFSSVVFQTVPITRTDMAEFVAETFSAYIDKQRIKSKKHLRS
jgi:hypothetical protein